MGNEAAVKKAPVKEKATAETPEVQATPVAEVAKVTPAVPVELNSTMSQGRLKLAEAMCNHYRAAWAMGTTKELIEHEPYWVHTGHLLAQGDIVDGLLDDASKYFRCIVLASGHQFAQLKVIEEISLEVAPPKTPTAMYYSKHRGLHLKWCAFRSSDDTVMKSGFESQKQANVWIENQELAMKR